MNNYATFTLAFSHPNNVSWEDVQRDLIEKLNQIHNDELGYRVNYVYCPKTEEEERFTDDF